MFDSSRYIIEDISKTIFICTPNYLFEELVDIAYDIAKKEKGSSLSAEKLINKIYKNQKFRNQNDRWNSCSWTKDECTFSKHLIEESFFYFDDLDHQYYFYLYRRIWNNEFSGGILHALTRHFSVFTKFNLSPNGEFDFQYNSFLWRVVDCSINGNIVVESKVDKGRGNYTINKEIAIEDKTLRVCLFWENTKKLFFLNTVIIVKPNKKNSSICT